MDTESLQIQFGIIDYVLKKNLDGISDRESRRRPVPGGNSLNWVVGHIVKSRNEALALTGRQPLFPEHKFSAYGGDGKEPDLALEELILCFEQLQQPLVEGLAQMSQEHLSQPAPFSPTGNPDETIGTLLTAIAFHEAYHAGQAGTLRRLLGKPGALVDPAAAGG